jgi:hypothetical protein
MSSKEKEGLYRANLAPFDGSSFQGLGDAMDVSE